MHKMPMAIERSAWWWVYFTLSAFAYLWSMVGGENSVVSFWWGLASGLSLVGLWGFITSMAIGWQTFWRYYFLIYVGGGLLRLTWLGYKTIPLDGESVFILALVMLLALPEILALGLYAFRSSSIWGSEPNA